MPHRNDEPISFGDHEIGNLLGAWGKADTSANRDTLYSEMKRFRGDQDWSPHTWERFYQYVDVRRLKRFLADKNGSATAKDELVASDYTIIEGWGPPAPAMSAPVMRTSESSPHFQKTSAVGPSVEAEHPPQAQKPAAVFPRSEKVAEITPRPRQEPETLNVIQPPPPKARTPEHPTPFTPPGNAAAPGGAALAPQEESEHKSAGLVPLLLALLGGIVIGAIILILTMARTASGGGEAASPQKTTGTAPPEASAAPPSPSALPAAERFIRTVHDNTPIYFIADKELFLPGEERKLDRILSGAEGLSRAELIVTGHTADNNMPAAQFVLSLERAQAVRDYLLKNAGGPVFLIEVKGRGALEPVVSDVPLSGQAANRRAEIMVKKAE